MALSKMSDLRELSTEEIETEIQQLKRELFDLRFQQATRQTVNPHEFKHRRHKIAQLMTLQHERSRQS
ncbi:50S ribosomal protein L29 [Lyngbya confervoides]|uniref:Large ribosomal subunit protein uL29 n=1 Tax=Lyngbya confervoides BDU141951 TaxID=1574623 RepID=A0ABD4T9V2_9CYAN|nr:50S ribosomal protein L29 [Lyngbya confervoides]MCM1985312.1 50S ribosomal protein L29 [Lyngbya confervoides BDU141951]